MTSLFTNARRARGSAFVLLMPLLMLALPLSSPAQAVNPAALVGQWALSGDAEPRYSFSADSTVTYLKVETTAGGKVVGTGRWHLSGDTLVLGTMTVEIDGTVLTEEMDPRVLAFKGNQLTMTRLHDRGTWKVRVLERVDSVPAAVPTRRQP